MIFLYIAIFAAFLFLYIKYKKKVNAWVKKIQYEYDRFMHNIKLMLSKRYPKLIKIPIKKPSLDKSNRDEKPIFVKPGFDRYPEMNGDFRMNKFSKKVEITPKIKSFNSAFSAKKLHKDNGIRSAPLQEDDIDNNGDGTIKEYSNQNIN